VTGLLDTSVIIRYFTGDPPHLAEASAALIEGEDDLLISDVAVAESAYVLQSNYGVPRDEVVDRLVWLLRRENIRTLQTDKDLICLGLLLCRPSGRVSYADAMLWAAARSDGSDIYTFDRRFPSDGITVRRPGSATA
jgi:predicted nucleic acid-binding protein